MSLDAARQRLYDEAIAFAGGDVNDRGQQRILCEAAKAYARAFDGAARNPPGAPPSPSPSSATDMMVPFGRDKGKRLSEVAGLSERFTEGCLTDLRRTLEVEKVVGFLPRFVITEKGEKALLAVELGYEEPTT